MTSPRLAVALFYFARVRSRDEVACNQYQPARLGKLYDARVVLFAWEFPASLIQADHVRRAANPGRNLRCAES